MTLSELEKRCHELLDGAVTQVLIGENRWPNLIQQAHAAITDLAEAGRAGGHVQNCRCHERKGQAACYFNPYDPLEEHSHPYRDPRCAAPLPAETREDLARELFFAWTTKRGIKSTWGGLTRFEIDTWLAVADAAAPDVGAKVERLEQEIAALKERAELAIKWVKNDAAPEDVIMVLEQGWKP